MSRIAELFTRQQPELLEEWLKEIPAGVRRSDLIRDSELREQCRALLSLLERGVREGDTQDLSRPQWAPLCEMVSEISRTRAAQGFTPTEVASFIYSLRQPLFRRLRGATKSADELAEDALEVSKLLDAMGMLTAEFYLRAREQVIAHQQQEMLELSTPVVKLWQGVLVLPLIGTLDSARTQVVMESLLERIVETGSEVAIIDITGVPTVDTLVAQHLLKTVTAARLMGADCIISGIRPQIAQTIVHLGVQLGDVTTKASLADAITLALSRSGYVITRAGA